MATVETYTIQEIGHNSGDVVSEEIGFSYEMTAFYDELDRVMAEHPDMYWVTAMEIAAANLRHRAAEDALDG